MPTGIREGAASCTDPADGLHWSCPFGPRRDPDPMRDRTSGFTLIEMLVVIGIISLLAVALLPNIIGARTAANQTADAAHLVFHYDNIILYEQRYSHYPRGTGHQWILDPWVRGVVEHTPQNMERYFTPGLSGGEVLALREELDRGGAIWTDPGSVTSLDTDYAGRDARRRTGNILSGKLPWMANDNEFGPAFTDGSINVLMGDRVVRTLYIDPDFLGYGWTVQMVEEPFPVGPDSPHPLLQQLVK